MAILDVMLLNTDGRMCMDQLCVDVTDIPCVRPGDTATLIEIGTEILSFGQRSCPGGAAPSLTD
jgi:alanine racemase